jgi:hypothetical protein
MADLAMRYLRRRALGMRADRFVIMNSSSRILFLKFVNKKARYSSSGLYTSHYGRLLGVT